MDKTLTEQQRVAIAYALDKIEIDIQFTTECRDRQQDRLKECGAASVTGTMWLEHIAKSESLLQELREHHSALSELIDMGGTKHEAH